MAHSSSIGRLYAAAILAAGASFATLCVPAMARAQQQGDVARERAREQRSRELKALFTRAVTAYNSADYGEAAALFLQAYAMEARAIFLYNAAKSNYRAGNLDLATSHLERAMARDAHAVALTASQLEDARALHAELTGPAARARAHYLEGLRAADREDWTGSIIAFKSGHALTPNALFTYNIAIAYINQGDFGQAYHYARETLAREEELTATLRARNRARLAAIERLERGQAVVGTIARGGIEALTLERTTPRIDPDRGLNLDSSTQRGLFALDQSAEADVTTKKASAPPSARDMVSPEVSRKRAKKSALAGAGAIALSLGVRALYTNHAASFGADFGQRLGDPSGRRLLLAPDRAAYALDDCDQLRETLLVDAPPASGEDMRACRQQLLLSKSLYTTVYASALAGGGLMVASGALLLRARRGERDAAARLIPTLVAPQVWRGGASITLRLAF